MDKLEEKEKRFIVRKYAMAKSAQEALQKESSLAPDEIFIDAEWKNDKEFSSAIGFQIEGQGRRYPTISTDAHFTQRRR